MMRVPILFFANLLLAVSISCQTSGGVSQTAPPAPTSSAAGVQNKQAPPADGARRISVDEAYLAVDKKKAVIVDVRGEASYKAGHVKGALWIPSGEIAGRIGELPRDKMIITYCS